MNRTVPLRTIIGSSAIIAAGYDASIRTLYIRFTGAKDVTIIEDVSPDTYQDFLAAKSKGKFFHERLKP